MEGLIMATKKKIETDKSQMGTVQKLRLRRLQKKIKKYQATHGKYHKTDTGNYKRHMSGDKLYDPKYEKLRKKFKDLGGDESGSVNY